MLPAEPQRPARAGGVGDARAAGCGTVRDSKGPRVPRAPGPLSTRGPDPPAPAACSVRREGTDAHRPPPAPPPAAPPKAPAVSRGATRCTGAAGGAPAHFPAAAGRGAGAGPRRIGRQETAHCSPAAARGREFPAPRGHKRTKQRLPSGRPASGPGGRRKRGPALR